MLLERIDIREINKNRPPILTTTSLITLKNRWDHFKARWGVDRMGHRVEPGLYKMGGPDENSAVFVTANYTLSFDALRSSLDGVDCYILVLNTFGVNVWCAAGKKTFGTNELVFRIQSAGLSEVVKHRRVILPQLGASGIAAHEVKEQSGFRVKYGPVLASDLPEYLEKRKATESMRRVLFPLWDRTVLIPVELTQVIIPSAALMLVFYFALGPLASAGILAATLAGAVGAPLLLPYLPGRELSVNGFSLGALVSVPFVFIAYFSGIDNAAWMRVGEALFYLLAIPSLTAFLTLQFTGSTTFTSPTGVRKEIFKYFPVMTKMFAGAVVLAVCIRLATVFGGSL